jgi:sec-independent protein translocase protein TatA
MGTAVLPVENLRLCWRGKYRATVNASGRAGELRPWHLLMLAIVVVLLFGSRRLPDAARALGRSLRILKAELHADAHEQQASEDDQPQRDLSAR